ncbi:MAG TPA: heavy metal-binding domain-containing protein [Caulobacteraceae bacterium]|nr:heavy metal-binding domain-containing protein [Caulobacteraceae bacterium]
MKINWTAPAALALATTVAASPLFAQGAAAPGEPRVTFVVFPAGASGPPPAVKSVLGTVSEQVCRRPWDTAATDAEALAPLEAKARALGANGLVDVRFDRHRASPKSACWQRLSVTGSAVVVQARDDSQTATR